MTLRYVFIDYSYTTNNANRTNTRKEYTLAVNYLIAGHSNKFAVDDVNPIQKFEEDHIRLK